jgi:uncharacterized protein
MNLLPVQPFQETLHKSYCGPAALKMVLNYYDIEKTEDELAALCGTTSDLGTDDQGIKRAAENCGLKVEIKNESTFDDIQGWLDKKTPVIVNWFTSGRPDYPEDSVPEGHYSVVVGLDDKNIYLQDPEVGRLRTITRDDFIRVWFDYTEDYPKSWEEMIIRQIIAIYK